LARELIQTLASGWKFGLLDHQNRKAVLDGECKLAALAEETFAFQLQAGPARVQWAAKDFE